jgi:hypothetical protein
LLRSVIFTAFTGASVQDHEPLTLESSLESTRAAAEAVRKATNSLSLTLKQAIDATSVGDLRIIRKAQDKAAQLLSDVTARLGELHATSRFYEGDYLSDGRYAAELNKVAAELGVLLVPRGDRLYSPPYEIRILANERAVMVGKQRIDKLRPSVLIEEIRRLQTKTVRLKPEEFLDVLRNGFIHVIARSADVAERRRVIPVVEIYELLTILPGVSKDYTIDDFARDLYLLDRSGIAQTKRSKGGVLNFIASSGTRSSKVLTIMTEEGLEQKYYAISFSED